MNTTLMELEKSLHRTQSEVYALQSEIYPLRFLSRSSTSSLSRFLAGPLSPIELPRKIFTSPFTTAL